MAAADEFLEAAQTLVDVSTPGRGHFRRAISTAYCASFLAVVEYVTDVTSGMPTARVAARDWFEHGKIAEVAQSIRETPNDPSKQANWVAGQGRALGLDHVVARISTASSVLAMLRKSVNVKNRQ